MARCESFKRFLASTILCTTCCTDEWRKIKFNYNSNNSNNANGNQIASIRSAIQRATETGWPKNEEREKTKTLITFISSKHVTW